MLVRVQLFAAPRSVVGQGEVTLELDDGATVRDLQKSLLTRYPMLTPFACSMKFAIDAAYAADDAQIPPGAEIACIPPVSGG